MSSTMISFWEEQDYSNIVRERCMLYKQNQITESEWYETSWRGLFFFYEDQLYFACYAIKKLQKFTSWTQTKKAEHGLLEESIW